MGRKAGRAVGALLVLSLAGGLARSRSRSVDVLSLLGESRAGGFPERCIDGEEPVMRRDDERAELVRDTCLGSVERGEFECLPDVEDLEHTVGRSAEMCDRLLEDLLRSIQGFQNPIDCRRALPAPSVGYGFGATFHYWVIQLKRAMQSGVVIGFPGFFLYGTQSESCPGASMECSFQSPTHSCDLQSSFADTYMHKWPAVAWSAKHDLAINSADAVNSGLFNCCSDEVHTAIGCESQQRLDAASVHRNCGEGQPERVPEPYSAMGQFRFTSALAGYLFALRPRVESQVRRILVDSGLDLGVRHGEVDGDHMLREGWIGVHVRRGDACHTNLYEKHNQDCVPTEVYGEVIQEIGEKYGSRRIFLASNGDLGLVEELRVLLPGYSIAVQNITNREKYACCDPGVTNCTAPHVECRHVHDMLRHHMSKERGDPSRGVEETFLTDIVADIVGLASCDFLVGTFTSQISRIALELSYFHKGYVVPFVSLDIAWCWLGFNRGILQHRDGRYIEYGC
jgi:hypothetical protein